MKSKAKFVVNITDQDRLNFADLSGDFNPMHVDSQYASKSEYKDCILHGAFSAGLLSRMAGMYLPGRECLLHAMNVKFISPIYTPEEIEVSGSIVKDNGEIGEVEVVIRSVDSGQVLVEGGYSFGRHTVYGSSATIKDSTSSSKVSYSNSTYITGASGGLGAALKDRLGSKATGLTRQSIPGLMTVNNLEELEKNNDFSGIDTIVHCAWPRPLKERLIDSDDTEKLFEYHFTKPLRDCLSLAKILKSKGTENAKLILVGSTFALPGRHSWQFPMYSLSKSVIPNLVKILSLELAPTNHRIFGVMFDVLDGGMNSAMPKMAKISAQDRYPSGKIPSLDEAADDLAWLVENNRNLLSGAMIELSGGAIP